MTFTNDFIEIKPFYGSNEGSAVTTYGLYVNFILVYIGSYIECLNYTNN